uniref:hypothetical protein n=1 Tax=Rheinheimera sp. TaxID=1869214 RepID=UPI0040486DDD
MSIATFTIIILFFAFMAIGMTLLATYFAALYKEEQRKNQALMKRKKNKRRQDKC